ncbi:MAG TPA: hypothetical protein VD884_13540 [Ohtaekwangia sp.]|nr:hypothetical protein [Ohtaekwangia sp.]
MELLDTDDEMKQDLLRKSAKHREKLQGEVKLITENTEKVITNALIIGGSLALSYLLMHQLTKGSDKRKHKVKHKKIKVVKAEAPEQVEVEEEDSTPGVFSQIGAAVASQASVFLLNLAKEKLTEFLQPQTEKKASS